MGSLDSKTALVTGGGAGIGYAIARRLAGDGAAVAVLDVSREAASAAAARIGKDTGVRSIAVQADVSDPGQVERAVGEIAGALGAPDILVNNAGIINPRLVVAEALTLDEFDRMHAVHVRGAFLVSRACVPAMKAKRFGRIVNVSSVAGLVGMPRRVAYSVAKSALIGFTRTLAMETARFGVTVNAVAPGYILTDTLRDRIRSGMLDHDLFAERTPVGRWGEPEEVAHLVAFLADPASAYVTGAIIPVDGGFSARGDPGESLE